MLHSNSIIVVYQLNIIFWSTLVEDTTSRYYITTKVCVIRLLSNGSKFSAKMGVTFLWIPIALGILVVISALVCFYFIFVRLKINHIIKKLLIFANVQQAIGFGIFVTSIISHASGFKNKLTCVLAITSVRASLIGNQASISAISIIRYTLTGCVYIKPWSQRPLFIEWILDRFLIMF